MLAGASTEEHGDAGLAGDGGVGVLMVCRPYPPTGDLAPWPTPQLARRTRSRRPEAGHDRRHGRPPAARARRAAEHAVTLASTYVAGGDREYGRYANPTWTAFEDALGALEGGRAWRSPAGSPRSRRCSTWSGRAPRVVAPRHSYNGTVMQLADLEARGRLNAQLVDVTDPEALVAACEDAALVWLESPTNPALEVIDLPPVIEAAHDGRRLRRRRQHLRHSRCSSGRSTSDADLVVHSATKFIAGHSDVLMGAVVTRYDELYDVLKNRRDLIGAIPGPLRGMAGAARSAHPRSAARPRPGQRAGARRVGSADHPAVSEVRYPGFGAIVAIVLAQGGMAADLLTHSTRLWVHATSLGGVESTFERRRRWKTEPATIPDSLVRMSRGHRGRRGPLGRPAVGPRRPPCNADGRLRQRPAWNTTASSPRSAAPRPLEAFYREHLGGGAALRGASRRRPPRGTPSLTADVFARPRSTSCAALPGGPADAECVARTDRPQRGGHASPREVEVASALPDRSRRPGAVAAMTPSTRYRHRIDDERTLAGCSTSLAGAHLRCSEPSPSSVALDDSACTRQRAALGITPRQRLGVR